MVIPNNEIGYSHSPRIAVHVCMYTYIWYLSVYLCNSCLNKVVCYNCPIVIVATRTLPPDHYPQTTTPWTTVYPLLIRCCIFSNKLCCFLCLEQCCSVNLNKLGVDYFTSVFSRYKLNRCLLHTHCFDGWSRKMIIFEHCMMNNAHSLLSLHIIYLK